MNIRKTLIPTLFALLGTPLVSVCTTQPRMFTGTIQFPELGQTPCVRVYHAGRKIPAQVSATSHKVTFTIPEFKTIFYFVITPSVEFHSVDNVVKYLKLNPEAPVKVYVLELVGHDGHQAGSTRNTLTALDKNPACPWHVREVFAPSNDARIPDDAIIIYLDPSWIAKVAGGTPVDFPKITIKPDIVTTMGSEEKIQEAAAQWLLAALNTDTIHGVLEQEVRTTPNSKTILAFNW